MAFQRATTLPHVAIGLETHGCAPHSIALGCAVALGAAGVCSGQTWAMPLLIAPVLEEVVFRTGLHETLLRFAATRGVRRPWPAALTAVAFAAAHLAVRPTLDSALTVVPALAIGVVYERRRRLLPCVALHAIFNALWWVSAHRLA
jgi:membrane protease YdiL (CAAX protease family)